MDQDTKQQLIDRLKDTSNVLVTVSTNPTVDQLAACIGLTLFLNKLEKHATAVFSGSVPSTIEFLKPEDTIEKDTNSLRDFIIALDKSKADKLRYKVEDKVVRIFITPYRTALNQNDLEFSQGDFNVDVVLALGVHAKEDLDKAITAHGRILHDATVVCINNTDVSNLGIINWQDKEASSLCEMIADLTEALQPNSLDAQMATALLTGIVAQTDRFSNPKTSSRTMSLSAKLMAAGANQQLVATKLQQSATAQVKSAPTSESAESEDGTLRISHQDDEPVKEEQKQTELPPVVPVSDASSDAEHQIKIDPQGNINNTPPKAAVNPDPTPVAEPPQEDKEPTKPSSTSRLTLDPPTLGGTLTANSRPEQLEPSTDPLSADNKSPILSHDSDTGGNTGTAPAASQVSDDQTLTSIEQQVGSPHLAAQQGSVTASSEPPQDSPTVETDDVSASTQPDMPDINALREAVNDAASEQPSPVVEQPAALGAQFLDPNVQGPHGDVATTDTPSAQTPNVSDLMQTVSSQEDTPAAPFAVPGASSPLSQPDSSALPPNLVPQDQGLPPEQTAAPVQNPTAPPPVPPPMMPPTNNNSQTPL